MMSTSGLPSMKWSIELQQKAEDDFWRLIIADHCISYAVCHDDARDWTLTELPLVGKSLTT
jgi:hypothetical protein